MEDEQLHGPVQDPPAPELIDDHEEYEVESILDSRMSGRQGLQYLVKWKGYGNEENSWEPERNLTNAQALLREYHHNHPQNPIRVSSLTMEPMQLQPLDTPTTATTSAQPLSPPAPSTTHAPQPHYK